MSKFICSAVDFTALFYAIGQFDINSIFSVIFLAVQLLINVVKLIVAIVKFFKNKNKSELDKNVSQIRDDILNSILKGESKIGKS